MTHWEEDNLEEPLVEVNTHARRKTKTPPHTGSYKPRVLFNKFRPESMHPKGPDGSEMPFIYDPADGIVHLGPPEAYHHELIARTPELKTQYPPLTKAPFLERPEHVHGRMTWPGKQTVVFGDHTPERIAELNAALGSTPKENPALADDDLWQD